MSDTTSSLARSMTGVASLTVGMAPGWAFVSFLGFAFNEQLGLSRTAIGLLAAAISVGYITAAIPFALHIDRSAGHWSLTRAPFVLAAGFLTVAATGAVVTLGPMALLAGGLWAGSVAALNRYVYHIAPTARQGVLFGITQTTVMVVSAVGSIVLPTIAASRGWRLAILLLAANAILTGAISTRLLPRTTVEMTRPDFPPSAATRERLEAPFFWLLVYGVLMGAAMHNAFAFLLIFLRDSEGLSSVVAGVGLGLLFLGGAVGRAGWGVALDRGRSTFLLLALSSSGGVAALVLMLTLEGTGVWLILPVFALGVLLLGHNTAFILLGMRISPRARAAVVAAGLTVSHVLGGVVGPPVFGILVDATESYRAAWLTTVAVLALSLVPLGVVWFLSRGPSQPAT